MMACFLVTTVLLTSVAFAVDALRSGNTITYDGKTFTQATAAQIPSDLTGTTGYIYTDTAARKAYFLFTSGDAATATTAVYTRYDTYTSPTDHGPPTVVSQGVAISAAPAGQTPAPTTPSANTDQQPAATADGSSEVATCDTGQTGGIGWLLCPVVNFLAKSMDHIYKIVSDFLVVRTVTADTNSSLYKMWDLVRNVANVCFVVAFMIIVYSQITGVGYSNYNLKKMLPRLIVGAILVNVSFWICAIGVDISNILGYSIHDMFMNIMRQFNSGEAYSNAVPSWEAVATAVLSAGLIVGAIGYTIASTTFVGALALLAPTIVMVFLAAMVALIVLAARQALITCLIIIAPLAFVAMLLPNTEKYFDKWRSVFMTMLLLFPIFSVIFCGAQLAGMAIIQNANGSIITIILGMAVQVAPIIITPLLVKFSGGLIGRIAGIVNNPNKGLIDRTRNWSQATAEERRNKVLAGQARFARNPINRATRAIDTNRRKREGYRKAYQSLAEANFQGTAAARDIKGLTKEAGNREQLHENRFANSARGRALELRSRHLGAEKQEIENRMMASAAGQRVEARTRHAGIEKTEVGTTFDETVEGQAVRARERVAEIRKTEVENTFNRSRRDIEFRARQAEIDKSRVHNEFEDSTLGHRADQAKREVERTKQLISTEHEKAWHFRNQTNAVSQEQEMRLRISTDEASLGKTKVDTIYSEIKAGNTTSLDAGITATVKQDLANSAYTVAEQTSLTAMRGNQAASELKSTINNALLTNAVTYQLDAAGNTVLDTAGKPIVVSQRHIDGKTLQDYAAGVGKRELVLATAIAEDRADWGKQASAASELLKHFKLESTQYEKLALRGASDSVADRTIIVKDDSGNEFTFDAADEYVKEAAITTMFKEGSYGQKLKIIKETGAEVPVYDDDGNQIGTRQGHNFHHRASVKSEAVSSGIAGLAPFINDVTYNEIIKGNFNGNDSVKMHALRQIFEGRIKASNLTGANNEALGILYGMGRLSKSANPADQAEFDRYKTQLFDLFADMYGTGSQRYQDIVDNFDDKFRDKWDGLLKTTKGIMENSTLNSNTSDESKGVMRSVLDDERVTYRER